MERKIWSESSSAQLLADGFNDILLHLAHFSAEFLDLLFQCLDIGRGFSRAVDAGYSLHGFFAGWDVPFRRRRGRIVASGHRWRAAGRWIGLTVFRCGCGSAAGGRGIFLLLGSCPPTSQSFGHFIHHGHGSSETGALRWSSSVGCVGAAGTSADAAALGWRRGLL